MTKKSEQIGLVITLLIVQFFIIHHVNEDFAGTIGDHLRSDSYWWFVATAGWLALYAIFRAVEEYFIGTPKQ